MNDEHSSTRTISLSAGTLGAIVFIVFLILKLTNTWDVSWFWVFFPLWIPIAATLAIYLLIIIPIALIVHFAERDK